MPRVSAAIRPGQALPGIAPGHIRRAATLYILAAFSSAFVALLIVASNTLTLHRGAVLRLIIALVAAFALGTLALVRPRLAVTATLVYLVFLAFLRRLLISSVGWMSFDPMLLVGYVVAVILLIKLYFLQRHSLAPDLLSKLILALFGFTVLEVGNPTGNGIGANLAGLMFMALPLLWYFVGRRVLDEEMIERILMLVVGLAVVVGAYGLYQTQVGDPPWDANWLNINSAYQALNVGSTVRAFGTFSSSAEYSLFIGAGLATAFALFLRGRAIFLLTVPLLAVSLFLASGRSALLLSFMAIVVMLGLRTHRPGLAVLVVACAIGAAIGGLKLFGSQLSSTASSSGSLVSHQISGITNPLDPNSSTLLVHLSLVVTGFEEGFTHPEGKGPGTTNNAAGVGSSSSSSNSSTTQATEVDISNAFVGLGVVGGFLYLGIVLLVLWKAATSYFAGNEFLLPVIGILVVAAGEWMNGGEYALCPLIWLLIGGVAKAAAETAERRRARPTPAPPPGDLVPAAPQPSF